jgi:hypothetical protein
MTRLRALALVAAVLVAGPSGAAVIRGKVKSGQGFVVNATSATGEGTRQTLGTDGAFRLVFPGTQARGATLQLISPNGRYFGPIVLRQHGGKAYIALAGRTANLGTIVLHEGYASPRKAVPGRVVDRKQVAAADAHGRPLGAGRLGVVAAGASLRRSVGREGGGDMSVNPGADDDGDGIINAFDADDDGDLRLDGVDADNSHESGGVFSTLFVEDLAQTLNVNVGAVTPVAIDALIHDHLNLVFYFDDEQLAGQTITSADVDCGALPYCAPGIGTAEFGGVSESPPDLFHGPWVSYDLNGDGLPNLEPITSHDGRGVHVASIRPLVTTAEIAAGDAFDVVFTTTTGVVRLPRSLPPYFVTVPAAISYDGGGGTQPITYPVAPGAPGTGGNPIALGTERLTLTFHRPQRPAIAGAESGAYVDMGHLHYGIPLQANNQEIACAGDYSALSPTLTDATTGSPDFALQLFPLTDSADDAAPSADNTLSFTLDLGSCLRRAGVDPAGQTLRLNLTATGESRPGGVDRAAQTITVQLPG